MTKFQVRESGFTLLELMVAMTIISILTAIALPQYGAYRKRAFDSRVLSDLRSVALAEEAYFFDAEKYIACNGLSCTTILPGFLALSQGTELTVALVDNEGFRAEATHPQGTGKRYVWDSTRGGMVE